jgi:hypothetical protein
MRVEARLEQLGLVLPAEALVPPGVQIPFRWVRTRGARAVLSGHGALLPDGTPAGPFGKVPSEVSLEDAQDLDKVTGWLVVNGLINADPGYAQTTAVMTPCSELLLALYGHEDGAHARTAIGVTALPLNFPVIISAEVEITDT